MPENFEGQGGESSRIEKQNRENFEQYRLEVKKSVETAIERVKTEKENRDYVELGDYPIERLQVEIARVIEKSLGISEGQLELSAPPSHVTGDFAVAVFELAKKLGKKPNELAVDIAKEINEGNWSLIKNASVAGPFVNIETQKEELYQETLLKILELDDRYGESDINIDKLAVIDYSAPNIAKPIGVGHLRSTNIGQALANIYHETGYSVIRDNHLGDWGTQFGSLIYAFQEWGGEKEPGKISVAELNDLYIRFNKFSKDHPEVKDKARELLARLEKKDPDLITLWKRFRDLSLKEFERVYDQLGIKFDTNIGESYFTDQADDLVDECVAKGYCKKDQGSEAVIAETENLPSFLLRKQDGSSIYLSRDLATIKFRANTFNPDSILYVVGSEQDLNFKQLFGLAKRTGYLPAGTEAKHVGFGLVLLEGKKMSTRKGTLIELEDLISQSVEKLREILRQKNPDLNPPDLDEISEVVGIGAILYHDLRQSRTKNVSFDWNRMLDLEGGSAVYLQYSYVRINSILKKLTDVYGEADLKNLGKNEISFENKSEFDLAKKLMLFPEIIVKAQKADSPHLICVYLEELALLFNSFYNSISIIKTEDKKLRNSRAALCKGVAIVIKKGLSLLNIEVPEKM